MRGIIDAIGRVLITVGLLILLFVVYQLWGTGILQARSQDALGEQFDRQVKEHNAGTTTTTLDPTAPTVPVPTAVPATIPPSNLPDTGQVVADLEIPKIGLNQYVIEGINVDDLRQGPGHYPSTPFPGQEGNVAIAGHRTTYGHPFGDLDQLATGDEIKLTDTQQVTHVYKVTRDPFAVSPDDGNVLLPTDDQAFPGHKLATLTLTTCNPKYSAAQRLIVTATLELPPGVAPLPPTVRENAPVAIAGLKGDTSSRAPAILWGAIVLLVGLAWWWLFHRYPRWYVWFAGAIPFFVVLFVFYTYFERLLPSSY
ncbi:MAG: class E sortase [Acidimicrobiia bacterium]